MARAGARRIGQAASVSGDFGKGSLFSKEGALLAAGPVDAKLKDILPGDVRLVDVLPEDVKLGYESRDLKLINVLPEDLTVIDVFRKEPTLHQVFPEYVKIDGAINTKLIDILPTATPQARHEDIQLGDPLAFPGFHFEH
jgi:hypothetical protein